MNISRARVIPQLAQVSIIAFCLPFCAACVQEQDSQAGHEPVVEELITLGPGRSIHHQPGTGRRAQRGRRIQ